MLRSLWKATLLIALGVGFAGFTPGAKADIINLDHSGPVDLAIDLLAGEYEITPIGTADGGADDAVSFWASNLGCDADGENCDQGWIWRFRLLDLSSAVFAAESFGIYEDPLDALAAAQAAGPFRFTLAADQTLRFVFVDSNYSDNRGGISLDLSRVTAVPEPSTLMLLGFGLIGVVAVNGAKRRKLWRAG